MAGVCSLFQAEIRGPRGSWQYPHLAELRGRRSFERFSPLLTLAGEKLLIDPSKQFPQIQQQLFRYGPALIIKEHSLLSC